MKPLVPRDWKTTSEIFAAGKKVLVIRKTIRGKQYPAFNGSQNNRKNKKRLITLPKISD